MNTAIRYYSKTGNTKKLADAISEVTGAEAQTVDVPLNDEVDILFLGSSVYAAGVDEKVKKFIQSLNSRKVKKVINFSTAAILTSTYSQVSKLLSEKNILADSREFHCRGSFKVMHKNRPNGEDISELKSFVKEVMKSE
ncbi:flavodoxin family protein [Paratissierella segnis]|uniref:Flavodoxin n=1 Tax=Paratissierella segnis TaxID=2763679 RepID=A0A926IFX4_9FIRM|nr:flavodoxin family protein [Paratissierella segnis]MBC8588972.1 flavodoxin [Paratissierella segnis]